MWVYVLISSYMDVDSGDYCNSVLGVFKTLEDAKQELDNQRKWTICDFENYDYESEDTIEEDWKWSIWEKDQEMTHRCELRIELEKVKQ